MTEETTEESVELTQEELALASADYDSDPEDTDSDEVTEDDADSVELPSNESPDEDGEDGLSPESVIEEVVEEESEDIEAGLSEDDYELGQSYGLSKEDVDQLGDKATLEKFGKIYDGQMLQEAKDRKEASKGKHASEEDSEQEQESEEVLEDKADKDEDKFDISKVDLSEYDKTTQKVFKVIDKLQGEVSSLRQRNVALEAQQENSTVEQFGRSLDEIDNEFYGKQYGESSSPNKIPKDQMDRRIELAEAIDTLTAGYTATGKVVPPLDVLVKNAHQITFAKRSEEVQKSNNAKRLKKQAGRTRGAGSRSTSRKVSQEPMDDEEREIQRIMELTEKPYRQMLDDNG